MVRRARLITVDTSKVERAGDVFRILLGGGGTLTRRVALEAGGRRVRRPPSRDFGAEGRGVSLQRRAVSHLGGTT